MEGELEKANETVSNKAIRKKATKTKRAFKDFAEYWHFVKNLPENQRRLLVNAMSKTEQKALKLSYDKGGWNDLFMRNACDSTLEEIQKQTGVDLLTVRVKVLAGKTQLMHKSLWHYVNECFERVPPEHIAYIFDNIVVEDHDADYIKLIRLPNGSLKGRPLNGKTNR